MIFIAKKGENVKIYALLCGIMNKWHKKSKYVVKKRILLSVVVYRNKKRPIGEIERLANNV